MKCQSLTIVVTGAASGLGFAVAKQLSIHGNNVAMLDINEAALALAAKEVGGMPLVCDVTSEASVTNALQSISEQLGPIHVLVNCAGIAPAERIAGKNGPHTLDMFKRVIDINLVGTFNVLRLVANYMSQQSLVQDERGVIINTASIAAFEGQIGQAAYSASKGGIVGMILPIARELARFAIRVMTIAPGVMATPLMTSLPTEVQASLGAAVPFPARLGQPAEFAELVIHIIENPYLNGSVIRLDGALRMGGK